MNEQCSNCRFWLKSAGCATGGLCRRYPPQVYGSIMEDRGHQWTNDTTSYPTTAEDEWCGEHQPQRSEKPGLPAPAQRPEETDDEYILRRHKMGMPIL